MGASSIGEYEERLVYEILEQKNVGSISYVKAYTFQQLWDELLDVCDSDELHLLYGDNVRSKELFIDDELFTSDSWADTAAEAVLWCIENGIEK